MRISHRKTLRVECVQNHQPTHSLNNFLCTPLNHSALWCSGSGWLYFHSVLLLRFRATPPLSQWGIGNGRVGVYSIYPVLDEPITFPDFTSLLCFSTVYIVGSWTSKLPSTTATTAATATTTDTTTTTTIQWACTTNLHGILGTHNPQHIERRPERTQRGPNSHWTRQTFDIICARFTQEKRWPSSCRIGFWLGSFFGSSYMKHLDAIFWQMCYFYVKQQALTFSEVAAQKAMS